MASLIRSSIIVSSMTMLSRVLGFVRDIIVLQLVGASGQADVFFMAQKIPNFLRRLFAEGAFAQSFVPVLTDLKVNGSKEDVLNFIGNIAGTLGGILLLVTVVGVLGSSGIMAVFANGFLDQPEKFDLASGLLKITFPYIFFISMTAFSGAILNTYGQFAIAAITPVFLNISLIVAALFIAPYVQPNVEALAWAIFVAGVVQMCFQLPFVWKLGLLTRPKWAWHDSHIRKVLTLMTPILFGVSVGQINLLFDSVIASYLVEGSIAWLYSADRLLEFPLGVFGIAIATVILPLLSDNQAKNSSKAFSESLVWGLRLVILIGAPCLAGLFLMADALTVTIYQRGNFTAYAAAQSAFALQAYSIGLLSFMFVKVLAPGYFARQDTKTPVNIGIKALVLNMFLNLALIFPLHHAGLALATALSATFNAFLLYRGLAKQNVIQSDGQWWRFLLKILVALMAMVAVVQMLNHEVHQWVAWSNFDRALNLTMIITAAALCYFMLLFALGFRPQDFKKSTAK
jgi:putative peptidoglycan lipid II flippase